MKVGWKATPLDRLADAYVVATPSETRSASINRINEMLATDP